MLISSSLFELDKWLYMQECTDNVSRDLFGGDEMLLLKEEGKPKEFFFASDASAVVEHTKSVVVIEDNEVVHIKVIDVIHLAVRTFATYTQIMAENSCCFCGNVIHQKDDHHKISAAL